MILEYIKDKLKSNKETQKVTSLLLSEKESIKYSENSNIVISNISVL